MTPQTQVEVRTLLYGLGQERQSAPILVAVPAQHVTAKEFIAAHVRAELARATTTRSQSLALHYLLADDVRTEPPADAAVDSEIEIVRAWNGFTNRRFLLSVNGEAVIDLATPLTVTARSVVCFVRLIPLVGG